MRAHGQPQPQSCCVYAHALGLATQNGSSRTGTLSWTDAGYLPAYYHDRHIAAAVRTAQPVMLGTK